MIIELHAIQTFGPSNLNRDDTGNPKEALFGGVRRARVSSQAAKRAMRVSEIFQQAISTKTGTRSKRILAELRQRLINAGIPEEQAQEGAAHVINATFAKPDKRDSDKTNVLVYISPDELDELAAYVQEACNAGKLPDEKQIKRDLVKRLKERGLAPDIALFGRMLADNPALKVDAACQVAHALSTHEVNSAEFDYFTAVDDWNPGEESGAGMLGLVAFNSATYYRCIRIDWEQLVSNLHGDTALAQNTVIAMMQAFALVVPTGMTNSFVNQHAPDFLLAVARPGNDGQSLDNAFEQPVRAQRGSGYAEPSVQRLAAYWEQVDRAFRISQPAVAVMNPRGYKLASQELMDAVQPDLQSWVAAITNELTTQGA
jgi:CRISPR system Cascade subunit CasC